ncbi:MAG: 1-acyl-sn-glycerol-3-phosphate acyltransferase [Myxococcaceae bacterium]|nr:1-acyl-sn-glycerol-3-phosphate acyltransferase [Myxococcaceae bacterium]
MFYAFVRSVVAFALKLFYRVEVNARPLPAEGPVIFVGNHPNALVDPALVFVITPRLVTFLAKAPLFRTPVIGWILKGLRALPVYRKQDDPTQMSKNEGTFEAATAALVSGGAITLFPEGRSHSEPMLAELKTGAARIAFRAAKRGAVAKIIPVGLTYEQKHRFRSRVLIDIGAPIDVSDFLPRDEAQEPEQVRRLTDAIATGLRAGTLNLAQWEDLPLIQVAEQLYAFRLGEAAEDPERLRRFATGIQIFRAEQPERFSTLREQVVSFKTRMDLVRANPEDLTVLYRRPVVCRFILRNLASLFLGFPLFLSGMVLYALPFWIPRWLNRALEVEWDQQATVKLVSALLLTPIWATLLTVLAWHFVSMWLGIATIVFCLPLAVFTRYFLERWRAVLRDVQVFLTLGSRARLKASLLVEGDRLSREIERVADEYRPRVDPAAPPVTRPVAG